MYLSIKPKGFKESKESKYDSQNTQLINSLNENQNPETEEELIGAYIQNYSLYEFYGGPIVNRMKVFSNSDFSKFKNFADKLIWSHYSVEKDNNKTHSTVDNSELHTELLKTFINVHKQWRTKEVPNLNGYLFKSFKNVFKNYAVQKDFNDKVKQDSNYKPVPIINWLTGKDEEE